MEIRKNLLNESCILPSSVLHWQVEPLDVPLNHRNADVALYPRNQFPFKYRFRLNQDVALIIEQWQLGVWYGFWTKVLFELADMERGVELATVR